MLLAFVVFAETGLFFGFFLPGDSLLFTAGLLTATGVLEQDITIVILSVSAAAFLGNYTGYFFGRKVGQNLYKRKESLFFKRRYIDMASNFYERYGGFSLIMGRFLPIIRTFALSWPALSAWISKSFPSLTWSAVSFGYSHWYYWATSSVKQCPMPWITWDISLLH